MGSDPTVGSPDSYFSGSSDGCDFYICTLCGEEIGCQVCGDSISKDIVPTLASHFARESNKVESLKTQEQDI